MEIWEYGDVKTTLEIDEDLHRRAKAHAALTGRRMKDLVAEGLRLVLEPRLKQPQPFAGQKDTAGESPEMAALWRCFREADEASAEMPAGSPAGRMILEESRNRLSRWEKS